MDIEKFKWDNFVDDVNTWKRTYEIYARKARDGKLIGLLALKDHVQKERDYFSHYVSERQQQYIANTLIELREAYDPDNDLGMLKNTLICVELKPESHLYEQFGNNICGQYLGMDEESVVTRIKNQEGEYIDEEGGIVVTIAYPTSSDVLKITFLDTNGFESF